MDYEAALTALSELRAAEAARAPEVFRNEAQTRFDLIDRLITECLGWTRDEVFVESSLGGQFTDYELGRPARQVVLEAKREGISFELPAGFNRPTATIPQLSRDHPLVGGAIEQALTYSQRRGIAIAGVANGHQLIAFIGSRVDGIAPEKGRALVFSSLADMEARFRELWDALSKAGVAARRLHRLLDADQDSPPPQKLSARLPDYPGYKNRNPVAAELQILGGLFFEDILSQPEIEIDFLRECYTPSGSLSQYALVSREILSARYSVFVEAEAAASLRPVRSKSGVSDELLSDVFAASLGRRPIILLGDVGVGKTMFTRHFIKVEASDILDRSLVLYVDFGSKPALADDINAYVRAEFRRQLLAEYGQDIEESGFVRSVYRSDLKRFANSIFGSLRDSDPSSYHLRELELLQSKLADQESHLKCSLDHFTRAQRRQAVVFLDNVDQRPFSFQEQVFLIAQSLAADWPVACFIALRPETFYRSKREGALTGYQPRVFTIEPPRVDRVILKRLRFARRELDRSGRLPTFPSNLTVTSDRLAAYIDVLTRAFGENEALVRFVDNMSGGNVRRALEFIVAFVGSGHVDTAKIFEVIDRQGTYDLPLHEFLRAVMYGEHEYYDPSDSHIPNVLDITRPDGREHFLQCLVIEYAARAGAMSASQGFARTEDIYSFCHGLGFDARQAASALNRCAAGSLLETSPRYIQEEVKGADSERVRVTTVGAYTTRQLLPDFQYLDAVSVDTPIIDTAARAAITDGRQIQERLHRAEVFRSYLDAQWAPFRGADLPFDWDTVSGVAQDNIDFVRSRVGRRIVRRPR